MHQGKDVRVAVHGSSTTPPLPDLELTREFRAPRALVWKTWTDPAHIVRWWGPHRFTCPHAEIDLKPGGALRFDMQGPDGRVFPSVGTVDDVSAPERLVITTRLEQGGEVIVEVRTTVTFEEVDGGTSVTLHARVLRATDAGMAPLAGMREGWNQSLDKMLSYAVTTAAERELVITRRFRAPIEAVWNAWTSPEQIEQWWGPTGFTTTTARFELAPGGQWAHTMHGPDGTDYPNVLTYREIVHGRRLSYTQRGGRAEEPPIQFEGSVVFERDEVGTRVTLRMVFASVEDRRIAIEDYGAFEGGLATLDRLANHLQVP